MGQSFPCVHSRYGLGLFWVCGTSSNQTVLAVVVTRDKPSILNTVYSTLHGRIKSKSKAYIMQMFTSKGFQIVGYVLSLSRPKCKRGPSCCSPKVLSLIVNNCSVVISRMSAFIDS